MESSFRVSHVSCCITGCNNSYATTHKSVKFYCFPNKPYEFNRRNIWIENIRTRAMNGKLWFPRPRDRICSNHFVGNLKSTIENHPSYNPTIFPQDYKNPRNKREVRKILVEHNYAAPLPDVNLNSNTPTTEKNVPETAFIPIKNEIDDVLENNNFELQNDPLPPYGTETHADIDHNMMMENTIAVGENSKNNINIKQEFPSFDETKYISEELVFEKPYFKSVKCFSPEDNRLAEVCRICFRALIDEEITKLYEDPSNRIKEMVTTVLPDLNLQLYPNVVICTKCMELVEHSHQLKQICFSTEQKLRKILEETKGVTNEDGDLIILGEASEEKSKVGHTTQNRKSDLTKPILKNILLSYKKQKLQEKMTITQQTDLNKVAKPVPTPPPKENLEAASATLNNISTSHEDQSKVFVFRGEVNLNDSVPIHSTQLSDQDDVSLCLCEKCGKIFMCRKFLEKHNILKHTSISTNIMCEVCGDFYPSEFGAQHYGGHYQDGKQSEMDE